jgi:hypothetical protein
MLNILTVTKEKDPVAARQGDVFCGTVCHVCNFSKDFASVVVLLVGCGLLLKCSWQGPYCPPGPSKAWCERWLCYHWDISFLVGLFSTRVICLFSELAFRVFCLFSEIKCLFSRGKVATPAKYLEMCAVTSEGESQSRI